MLPHPLVRIVYFPAKIERAYANCLDLFIHSILQLLSSLFFSIQCNPHSTYRNLEVSHAIQKSLINLSVPSMTPSISKSINEWGEHNMCTHVKRKLCKESRKLYYLADLDSIWLPGTLHITHTISICIFSRLSHRNVTFSGLAGLTYFSL